MDQETWSRKLSMKETVTYRSVGRYSGLLKSSKLEDLGLNSMFITCQPCDLGQVT